MTTVPNSVRKIAPVGHTSRQPACVQCLQTSDDMSQRKSAFCGCCSMNATCRHEFASSLLVLSYDSPVNSSPSSGMTFHSLHATSHALQPMQIVVSVKKPCRGFGSAYVAWPSALTVGLHELRQRRPARTSPRPDVARRRLHLLDVDVRVEDDRVDVV